MTYKLVLVEPTEGVAVETAYLTLLKMPFGELRVRAQKALAELRDLVAFARGEFPADVQEEFERRAATPTISQNYRDEVARAIHPHIARVTQDFDSELDAAEMRHAREIADAAISTLQRLGWKPEKEEG